MRKDIDDDGTLNSDRSSSGHRIPEKFHLSPMPDNVKIEFKLVSSHPLLVRWSRAIDYYVLGKHHNSTTI